MKKDETFTIRVPIGKPRNPHAKELFDGTIGGGGKHEPKKERFKPNYEALIEEEEENLFYEPDEQIDDDADQNWRDYLNSQNITTDGGNVTPENEQTI